ncbi:MAG: hypothetical protein ABIG64_07430 [Candidatus Omnitrophota bacterium]
MATNNRIIKMLCLFAFCSFICLICLPQSTVIAGVEKIQQNMLSPQISLSILALPKSWVNNSYVTLKNSSQFPLKDWELNYNAVMADSWHNKDLTQTPWLKAQTIGQRKELIQQGFFIILDLNGNIIDKQKNMTQLKLSLNKLLKTHPVLIIEGKKTKKNTDIILWGKYYIRYAGQSSQPVRMFFSQNPNSDFPILRAVCRNHYDKADPNFLIPFEFYTKQGILYDTQLEVKEKYNAWTGFIAGIPTNDLKAFRYLTKFPAQKYFSPFINSLLLIWTENGSPYRLYPLSSTAEQQTENKFFDDFIRIEYYNPEDGQWHLFLTISNESGKSFLTYSALFNLLDSLKIKSTQIRVRYLKVQVLDKTQRYVNFCKKHILPNNFNPQENVEIQVIVSGKKLIISHIKSQENQEKQSFPIQIFGSKNQTLRSTHKKIPVLHNKKQPLDPESKSVLEYLDLSKNNNQPGDILTLWQMGPNLRIENKPVAGTKLHLTLVPGQNLIYYLEKNLSTDKVTFWTDHNGLPCILAPQQKLIDFDTVIYILSIDDYDKNKPQIFGQAKPITIREALKHNALAKLNPQAYDYLINAIKKTVDFKLLEVCKKYPDFKIYQKILNTKDLKQRILLLVQKINEITQTYSADDIKMHEFFINAIFPKFQKDFLTLRIEQSI